MLSLGLLNGCGSKSGSGHSEDPVLRAYRLIDAQRDDEAIELLESSMTQNPESDYEMKVVLASAYAHKAGIKIQKLVPVLNQSDSLSKLSKKSKWDHSEQISSQVDQSALNVAHLLSKFASVMEVYVAVPRIENERVIYLTHAIEILNSLGKTLRPEDVVYRVLLEGVLFKNILSEKLIGDFLPPQTKGLPRCQINLAQVNDSIVVLGKLLIDIYTDLGFVHPKQAKDMKKLADETANSVSNITLATTSLILIDDASHIFLKQAIIEGGFGKIMKCQAQEP